MTSAKPFKQYYRVDEVAKYFSVSVRTVYRLIEDGDLNRSKIRGCLRIPLTCDVNSRHQDSSCCHLHGVILLFKCSRGEVAQSCLGPLSVVENLYVLRDLSDGLLPCHITTMIYQFRL